MVPLPHASMPGQRRARAGRLLVSTTLSLVGFAAALIVCAGDVAAQGRPPVIELGERLSNQASPSGQRLSLSGAQLALTSVAPSAGVLEDALEQLVCRGPSCVIDTLRCSGAVRSVAASIGGRVLRNGVSVDLEARDRSSATERAFCEAFDGVFALSSRGAWGALVVTANGHRARLAPAVGGRVSNTLGAIGRGSLNAGVPLSRAASDATAVLFTETSVALIAANMQGAPQVDAIVSSQCGGSICRFATARCEGEVREARSPVAAGMVMRVDARAVGGSSDAAFCAAISGDLAVPRVGINPGARFWGVALGDWYSLPQGTHAQTACLVAHPNADTQIRVGQRCMTLDARRAQSWPGPCCVGTPEITVDFPRTTQRNTMASHDPAPPVAMSPDGAWLVVLPRQRSLSAEERAANVVLARAWPRGGAAPIEYRADALFSPSALPGGGAGYSFSIELDGDKVVGRVNGVERRVLLGSR
jgi:hypothetical protein